MPPSINFKPTPTLWLAGAGVPRCCRRCPSSSLPCQQLAALHTSSVPDPSCQAPSADWCRSAWPQQRQPKPSAPPVSSMPS